MNTTQRELERRIFHLNALNELGKELSPLQDREAICKTALSVTIGTIGAMRGIVLLGEQDTSPPICIMRGIGMDEPPAVSISDLETNKENGVKIIAHLKNNLGTLLKNTGMILWVPLNIDDQWIGGFGLGPKMSGEGFTQEDQSLLSTIADTTTMALRNAMHYNTLQQAYKHLKQENHSLRTQLEPAPNMRSRNPQMQTLLNLAMRVANTPTTILLTGESGTGKEVLARAIHQASERKGNFVPIHCAALPTALLESELFGHEKGAFTNAIEQRKGRFEHADQGTLFLDEVSEMPPEVQVKLLRVLQEQTFERVGSSITQKVDVRVIAATNQNLETAVQNGTFREDLYYRLNVVPITLIPLRDRTEDIPALVDIFVKQSCQQTGRNLKHISKEVIEQFMTYPWPGNVRELQNLIERLVVISINDIINLQELPDNILTQKEDTSIEDEPQTSLAEVERQFLENALIQCKWNQSETARVLGISRTKLRDRIKRYNIQGTWRVGAPGRKNS